MYAVAIKGEERLPGDWKQIYVSAKLQGSNEAWLGGVATIESSCGGVGLAAGIFCYPGRCSQFLQKQSKIVMDEVDDDAVLGGVVSVGPLYSQNVKDVLSIIAPRWISDCIRPHPHCTDVTISPISTRVLDVGPADDSKESFIFITEGSSDS